MIAVADVLALLGGFLGSVCSVPQLFLMFRSGSAKDISALFTSLYFISLALQATYMTMKSAWAGAIALWIETALAFIFFSGKLYFLLMEKQRENFQEKSIQDSEITMEVTIDLNELAKNLSNTLLMGLAQHPSPIVQLQTSSSSAKNLAEILHSNNVLVGTYSTCNNFCLTAKYHLSKKSNKPPQAMSCFMGERKSLLLPECLHCHARNSFLDLDIGAAVSQIYQCNTLFPRADIYFPIRGIPNPLLIKALAVMGCHFDCASCEDIHLVRSITRDLPSPYNSPEIIFTKLNYESHTDLIDAVYSGINYAVFDNMAALMLYASIKLQIKLVLRINIESSGQQCNASCRSGAPRHAWPSLLKAAKQQGLEVAGVSFHNGSRRIKHYKQALYDSRVLFDLAESEFGFRMKFLDIGNVFNSETVPERNLKEVEKSPQDHGSLVPFGYFKDKKNLAEDRDDGMTGDIKKDFSKGMVDSTNFFDAIMPMLENLFPEKSGVQIITKPGRFQATLPSSPIKSLVSIYQTMPRKNLPPISIFDAVALMYVHTKTSAEGDTAKTSVAL
jgi:uncharacterized protein with PQ loop repeat